MSDILNHPALKDLVPETEREGLLYAKAFFQGIEATLKTIKQFGLEETEKFHQKMMADLQGRVRDDAE